MDSAELERRRLTFIGARDGEDAAKDFAARTYRQYRNALRTGYGGAYRRQLLASFMVFRPGTCVPVRFHEHAGQGGKEEERRPSLIATPTWC